MAKYSVDSIKRTVLLNILSLLSVLFSTVISKKISIKNTVYQEKEVCEKLNVRSKEYTLYGT